MPPPPEFERSARSRGQGRWQLRLWQAVLLAVLLHLLGILGSRFISWRALLAPDVVSQIVPVEEGSGTIPFRIVEDDDLTPPPPEPPPETVHSDRDRAAASPSPPEPEPTPPKNPQPRSIGNTEEMVPRVSRLPIPPPQGSPQPEARSEEPSAGEEQSESTQPSPDGEAAEPGSRASARGKHRPGLLDDLKALQAGEKPMGSVFDNPDGTLYQSDRGISFETKGIDWGPYAEKIYWIVKRNWIIPPSAQVGNKGVTRLRFVILRDGTIQELQVLRESGYKSMDQSAFAAIQNSGPLPPPPIPEDFPEDQVGVQWTFYYNVRPSD